ncbi:hypothetical protein BUALT_BualtUnG0020800 [Buddleja alternifolia]|uniref:Gnk2-homologous domain-containing protein n=1 Tax=Buddleja alternifolia TaxID=168488 RepID=A0AAV6W5I2_9LAMI|nr:hypothetical protein BUALT_BualtUnG0020800 [Buddleja alternifolia]
MGSCQTWLPFFISVILTNISSTFVTAQNYFCFNNGNYTSNSTYSNNLNAILPSIPSNMSSQGFLNSSVGQNPDRVNVIALCRGDVQPDTCRSCIQNATTELLDLCPYQRQAILWSELCTLRYSNDSIFGNMADIPAVMMHNMDNASSPQQFNADLRTLFDQLRDEAASGGSLIKVAAGNRTAPDFQTIYGLLQCSPDISHDDCNPCLATAAQRHLGYFPNSRGWRILQPSCTVRFESYPFYNLSRIQEAQPTALGPAPPPPTLPSPPILSPPPGYDNDNTTRTVIIIVVVIIVSITIVACVGIFMRKRTKHKAKENIEHDEELSTAESLQYDFGKIRAATNDFSDSSKLGQGGFGAVYKAWRNWRERTTTNMIDPVLRASSGFLQDMLRCIHIGLLCVQENVGDRPTMASVVLMLNSFSITLQLPSRPAFFESTSFDEDASLLHNRRSRELEFKDLEFKESSETKSIPSSRNDASITELYPR